ncbi:mechanosensitive ion channel [Sulfitobacter sp. F26204]|uniref:mechanosensitive ion channel family protein n=1 Tax=Sulfitobacter sp. F26204 TaxID=2996014 RepID=UPI00225E1AE8|nr:mechanosensitive ion channel domain-containing protein [Sulfitobacter sp. F26204]MCX7560199.1 mechanosensitive ion channel [Sulfitobacter sp. F26204]
MEDRTERLTKLFNDIDGWVIAEILLSILLVWIFIKATQKILPWLGEFLPANLRTLTLSSVPVLRVVALVVLIIWVVPLIFNITLQNFVFIAGAFSVAVGFAVKDLASSVIAGLVALFEKPYRLGDWIKIGDDYGEVVAIGMRAVKIRTPEDNVVTIAHDRIWTDNVSNANDGFGTLMCVATFYVARNQPLHEISQLLKTVARTSAYLNLDRDVIVVMENSPFCMVYKLKAYPFEPRNQFAFITDMTERGNTALHDAGIVAATIPEDFISRRRQNQ